MAAEAVAEDSEAAVVAEVVAEVVVEDSETVATAEAVAAEEVNLSVVVKIVVVVEIDPLIPVRSSLFMRKVDVYLCNLEREMMTDSIYVGQLPTDVQESDLKKLFPKASKIEITPAVGTRPGLVIFSH